MQIFIQKSDKPEKKYSATVTNNGAILKKIYFGDSNYQDYTQRRDKERRRRYRARAQNIEDKRGFRTYTDPMTANFYSYWLLWNKPTIEKSIAWVNKNLGFPEDLNITLVK